MISKCSIAIFLLALIAPASAETGGGGPLDPLVGPYLKIQTALAGDDFKGANGGATELLNTIAGASGDAVVLGPLRDLARVVAAAGDIQAVRRGFKPLSSELIRLAKEPDASSDLTLYLTHCPMALGGEGGSWIQEGTTVANPYFGASMLRCGTVREQLGNEGATVRE